MLYSCVLVGLDWTKPMIFLLLQITCLCIFHAYILSFLYILILICIGAFLFVSLSLSFYALVCSMAPKHKSAPSRNPLRSRASSSDSTLSHVRFRDKKAKLDISKNFSRRGIHSVCHIVLSDFSDTDLSHCHLQ